MRKEVPDLPLDLSPPCDVDDSTLSIAPEEFCQLAVSSRPLVRCDDLERGFKGLRDRETGESFIVDAAELHAHNVTPT